MFLKEFFELNPFKRFLNLYINRFVLPLALDFVEKYNSGTGKFTIVHDNLVFSPVNGPRPTYEES